MTESQPSDDLIARVLAGEATPEESAAVEAWAAGSPEHRATLQRLGALWRGRVATAEWDVDQAWARVSSQLDSGDDRVDVIPIPRAPAWSTTAWRIAAAVLVVLGLGFAWQTLRGGTIAYATGPGEVREFALDDGTVVALAPRSRLEVPDDYPASRTLVLEGEGWFSVGTGSEAPFAVEAGEHLVRDIGTVFTLRTRHADSLEVLVIEGMVMVAGGSGRADTVAAAQEAGFAVGATPHIGPADAAALARAEWRTGSLSFTSTPAAAVLARLADWHGVDIRLADPQISASPITATIPTDSLDEALDILALLLDVTVERDGEAIVLR